MVSVAKYNSIHGPSKRLIATPQKRTPSLLKMRGFSPKNGTIFYSHSYRMLTFTFCTEVPLVIESE